jgi:hypothetical protein
LHAGADLKLHHENYAVGGHGRDAGSSKRSILTTEKRIVHDVQR